MPFLLGIFLASSFLLFDHAFFNGNFLRGVTFTYPLPTPTSLPSGFAGLIHPTIHQTQSVLSLFIPNNSSTEDIVWDRLAECESGGNWAENTGNGYYGGLQFTLGTWYGVGGIRMPNEASKDEQIMRAKMLQSQRGWEPWPECSRKLGLR